MSKLINGKSKFFIPIVMLIAVLFVAIPSNPAHADFHDGIENLLDDLDDAVDDVGDAVDDSINEIKKVGRKVAEVAVQVGDKLYDFLKDMVQLIVGFHPSQLADVVTFSEDLCSVLPTVLENPKDYFGTELDFLEDQIPFADFLKEKVGFSLFDIHLPSGIKGIDPQTATSLELYEYNLYTVKPLSAIADMTASPFNIPAVLGSSLAGFCAEATEFYLSQQEGNQKLIEDIHHDLSRGGNNKNALFQLPNSADGYLEDVETVVIETVTTYEDLGMNVGRDVYKELARGQTNLDKGLYREAYKSFQSAYKKLTQS